MEPRRDAAERVAPSADHRRREAATETATEVHAADARAVKDRGVGCGQLVSLGPDHRVGPTLCAPKWSASLRHGPAADVRAEPPRPRAAGAPSGSGPPPSAGARAIGLLHARTRAPGAPSRFPAHRRTSSGAARPLALQSPPARRGCWLERPGSGVAPPR